MVVSLVKSQYKGGGGHLGMWDFPLEYKYCTYNGIFRTVGHHPKIKTVKLFYGNRFYVTILSCTNI